MLKKAFSLQTHTYTQTHTYRHTLDVAVICIWKHRAEPSS